MFKESKFVEAFDADDIKRELGLTQDSMIALALLLGSDYTEGIRGIGIGKLITFWWLCIY
jgi:DNA excision repair protein ERCC-5